MNCHHLVTTQQRPLAMHVAQSPHERELLQAGTGPFAESIKLIGVWRDDLFSCTENPFQMLIERLGKAPRSLLIHGNDFNDSEIAKLP